MRPLTINLAADLLAHVQAVRRSHRFFNDSQAIRHIITEHRAMKLRSPLSNIPSGGGTGGLDHGDGPTIQKNAAFNRKGDRRV